MIRISQDEADKLIIDKKGFYAEDIEGNVYLLGCGSEIIVISSDSVAEFEAQKAIQEQKNKEAALNGA